MQLQTLGKGRFEEKWSQDKQLIEQTILNCISARRIFDENEKPLGSIKFNQNNKEV